MNKKPKRSLEQRLHDAWRLGVGCRLSPKDVGRLILDDAVACRITNKACQESGIDELGADEITIADQDETWARLKARLLSHEGDRIDAKLRKGSA